MSTREWRVNLYLYGGISVTHIRCSYIRACKHARYLLIKSPAILVRLEQLR